MPAHQLCVPLARFGVPPLGLESLDRRGSTAISFAAGKARRLSSCHEIRLERRNVYCCRRMRPETGFNSHPLYRLTGGWLAYGFRNGTLWLPPSGGITWPEASRGGYPGNIAPAQRII